jgi:hypothetical protein
MSAALVSIVPNRVHSSAQHFVSGDFEGVWLGAKVCSRDRCGHFTLVLANQFHDRLLVGRFRPHECWRFAFADACGELFDERHIPVQEEQVVESSLGRRTGGQLGDDELSHGPVDRLISLSVLSLGSGDQGNSREGVRAEAGSGGLDVGLTCEPVKELWSVTLGHTRVG